MTSADVESLKPSAPSRSRCLDTCLLGSVIILFILVLGGAVAALLFVRNLRPGVVELESTPVQRVADGRHINPDLLNYKGQNFAFLRANFHEIKDNAVLKWESVPYGQGHTVGSAYSYDSVQQVLSVTQEGSYFIYMQLRFTCTHMCKNATLAVTFEDQRQTKHLSCVVELPDGFKDTPRNCWTVIPHLDKESRLLARVKVNGTNNWKIDMNESGFGMFRVD